MALPTPLYALLEGGTQVKIVGAVLETRKPIIVFDKDMYRDSPPSVVGGAAIINGAGISASVAGGTTQTVSGVGESIIAPSAVVQDDNFTHVPKRYVPKLDTLVEFWDAATPGLAMTLSVTTVSGSGVITVPDAQLLTPGQGISGSGIPAGTTILEILSQANGVITKTTAVMSQAATASATVAATLTGSNKVGEFIQSEFLDWGSENTIPT